MKYLVDKILRMWNRVRLWRARRFLKAYARDARAKYLGEVLIHADAAAKKTAGPDPIVTYITNKGFEGTL